MRRHHTPTLGLAASAVAIGLTFWPLASPARADDANEPEATPSVPRPRAGVGLGGSWLPVFGDTSTLVARVSAGFDVGRFRLRALPTFQYVTSARWPPRTMTAGYLAVESAFRVTPAFGISIAPLAGYAHSPEPCPECYDVVYEGYGNGLMLGLDVSPATFAFGPERSFEVGLHGNVFDFLRRDQQAMVSGYVELRWTFARPGARVVASDDRRESRQD